MTPLKTRSVLRLGLIGFSLVLVGGAIFWYQNLQEPQNSQQVKLKKIVDKGKALLKRQNFRKGYRVFDSGLLKAQAFKDSFYIGTFLINKGAAAFRLGDFRHAKKHFKAGYQVLSVATPDSFKTRSLAANNLAVIYDKKEANDSALSYYKKALALHEKADPKANKGVYWMNMGNLYNGKGQYQLAINHYLKALKAFQKTDQVTKNERRTYENIGIVYIELYKPSLALKYLRKALSKGQKDPSLNLKANVHENMAEAYLEMDSLEKAVPHLQKGEVLNNKIGDVYSLVSVWKKQARLALRKDQTQKALKVLERITDTLKQKNYKVYKPETYLLKGKGLSQANEPRKAKQFYFSALNLSRKRNDSNVLKKAYRALGKHYEDQNQLDSALWAFKQHNQIQKRRSRLLNQKKAENLRSEFAFRRQQQQIQILKKQKKIQSLKAERRQRLVYAMGGGILLVLVVTGLLYRLNRSRQKANQQLRQKNKLVEEKNQALERANEEVKKASEAKSKFLAMVSHEIRTPINGVMGMTEMLKETKLNGEQDEYVKAIRSSGEALLTVINDVLDLTRAEQGRITINDYSFSLNELLNDIESLLKPVIQNKGLAFHKHLDETLPTYIRTDGNRLRQMIINLLNNAMKFTSEGNVLLDVYNQGIEKNSKDQKRWIAFAITDTGQGIEQEVQNQLFKAFEQGNETSPDSKEGIGLGLAICHSISQAMGGYIDLKSQVGEGSTFTVHLPVKEGSANESTNYPYADGSGKTPDQSLSQKYSLDILVVEDDQLNREIACRFLSSYGYEAKMARDGAEAVKMIEEGHSPDLILMDIQMPRKDGLTAMSEIKSFFKENERPLIVALTADAMEGANEQYLKAGMDDYISKPFKKDRFRTLLQKWGEALKK